MTDAPYPRIGVGAALLRGGKLLLIQRRCAPEAGCWSFPGGRLEWMEPVETAVAREVAEEVGVTLGAISLLCMTEWIAPERGEHWTAPVYLATEFTGEPHLVEPECHAGLGWFALDALPRPLTEAVQKTVAILRQRG